MVAAALTLVAALAALPAGSAEADPTPDPGAAGVAAGPSTPWAGWVLQRPGGPEHTSDATHASRLAGAGAVELLSAGGAFQASDGSRTVAGSVPGLTTTTFDAVAPVVLPSGRLLATDGTTAATSDDLGIRWTTSPLPATGPGRRTGPVFSDDRHGVLLIDTPPLSSGDAPPPRARQTGPAVLATTDAGSTWTLVHPPEPGASGTSRSAPGGPAATTRAPDQAPPPESRAAVDALVAGPDGSLLRVVDEPTPVLERSDDDGATWTRMPLPGVPTPEAATRTPPPAVPDVGTPGLLARGGVVVPVGGALLVSDDGLRTFRRVVPPGAAPRVLCDPAGGCLVDVADPERSGEHFAVAFDGTSFGPRLPALPDRAVAPAPGVVLGVRAAPDLRQTTVRSDDHGAPYRASDRSPSGVAWVPTGSGALRARTADGRLEVAPDGVSFSSLPLPADGAELDVVSPAPDGVVALDETGHVRREIDGGWSSWDAGALMPQAVAADGDTEIAVGRGGVLVRRGGRTTRTVTVRHDRLLGRSGLSTPAGRGLFGVALRGRLAFAWGADDDRTGVDPRQQQGLLRSTDGGRTWRRIAAARFTDDLQILRDGTVLRVYRSTVFASRDGGRTFRERGHLQGIGNYDRARIGIRDDARTGVIGTSATTDAGRTLMRIPLVAGGTSVLGLDGRDVVEAGPLGSVLRAPGLLGTAPRPVTTAESDGRSTAGTRTGTRSFAVRGRVSGVPAGTTVQFSVSTAPPGLLRHGTTVAGSTDAEGRFSGRVAFRPGRDRRWRATTPGVVGTGGTTLDGDSSWKAVPR